MLNAPIHSQILLNNLEFFIDSLDPVCYNGSGTTLTSIFGSQTASLQGTASVYTKTAIEKTNYINISGATTPYLTTSYKPNLDNNALLTWELWFWDNAAGDPLLENTALISNYGQVGTTPCSLVHMQPNGLIRMGERNTAGLEYTFYTTTSICDGIWHHIVRVCDSTQQILYIDGVQVLIGARPGGVITSDQNIVIGGGHLSRYQSCRIGTVRMYKNYAFSNTEVLRHYNSEKNRFT